MTQPILETLVLLFFSPFVCINRFNGLVNHFVSAHGLLPDVFAAHGAHLLSQKALREALMAEGVSTDCNTTTNYVLETDGAVNFLDMCKWISHSSVNSKQFTFFLFNWADSSRLCCLDWSWLRLTTLIVSLQIACFRIRLDNQCLSNSCLFDAIYIRSFKSWLSFYWCHIFIKNLLLIWLVIYRHFKKLPLISLSYSIRI